MKRRVNSVFEKLNKENKDSVLEGNDIQVRGAQHLRIMTLYLLPHTTNMILAFIDILYILKLLNETSRLKRYLSHK